MIATAFSLCCFAAVLLVGAVAEQSLIRLFLSATVVLILSHMVGLLIGRLIQSTLSEGLRQYEQRHPAPELKLAGDETTEAETVETESKDKNPGSSTWDPRKRAAA